MRIPSVIVALGLMLLPIGVAPTALAQETTLDRVEEMMVEGRFESARWALEAWNAEGASRLDRQRGLWLRARLTIDPSMAELDLRRLAVEYPGGPFSDGALLRLARLADANGAIDESRRHLERLLRDYPRSRYREEAVLMIGGLRSGVLPAVEPPAPPDPLAPLPSAAPPNPATPETPVLPDLPTPPDQPVLPDLPTQPEFPGPPDVSTPTAAGNPPAPVFFDGLAFTVQLGAFSTESRAYTLAATADAMAVEIRLVRLVGSDLFHVRTGAFSSEQEAEARALELRLQGLPALVLDDRDEEVPFP